MLEGLGHPAIVAAAPSARGSATEDILVAGAVTVVGLALVAWFTRRGRRTGTGAVRKLAMFSARISGLPLWAALPGVVGGASMLMACFGYYWDVATHIDTGRDAGPFGNPAHFLVLGGLLGIAAAGFLSGLLADRRPPRSAVRIGVLRFPAGGLLMVLCGAFALLGFPLDEVWHRLFGQDVTVWGPTHIQMIAGASVPTLGLWMLLAEASRAEDIAERGRRLIRRAEPWVAGAFLIGLSALQSEFDHGIPQFRLLYHPILLALAGMGLVAARVRLGRWGALQAALVFVAIRGVVTLIVAPGFGHITGHFPLYLVEAAAVELVAVWLRPSRRLAFGVVTGVAIGTIGLAAEWAWSHVWMPLSWPAALLPEAVIFGAIAGLATGLLGVSIGDALQGVRARAARWIVPASLAAGFVVLAVPAPTSPPADVRAGVVVDRVTHGSAHLRIRLDPPNAADDAVWFHALSWQGMTSGSGPSHVVALDETRPGEFATAEPVAIGGGWKTLVRLHTDDRLMALPVRLPADAAIPAPAVPAPAAFERAFVSDKEIVQREATVTTGTVLRVAYASIGLIALVWLAAVVWTTARLTRPALSPKADDSSAGPARVSPEPYVSSRRA